MANGSRASLAGGLGLGLTALLILMSSVLRVFYIGGDGWCDVLWNDKEVFLLVHGVRLGYSFSYLGTAGELAKEYFGIVPHPEERRPFTTVIHITSSGPTRYEENQDFYGETPVEGSLYAVRQNDPSLWKWAGTHFEKADAEEQRKASDIVGPPRRKDFTDVDGWSGRYSIGSNSETQFSIHLDTLLVTAKVEDDQVVISVVPPGQTFTERIRYNHAAQLSHVGKSEYERVFGN
jgi:hypothetical protein